MSQTPIDEQPNAAAATEPNGMAVTSLVLGIIALVFVWFPFLSWILGILGIIFGGVGVTKPSKKGMAKAGLVLSIITIALKILFWVGLFSSL
ncbi:MAG TPA: DUF4190 domain-containing protein [Bacillales bacterium]|nr:DUF4190 domain-containing protein [Bacillales bacterium]